MHEYAACISRYICNSTSVSSDLSHSHSRSSLSCKEANCILHRYFAYFFCVCLNHFGCVQASSEEQFRSNLLFSMECGNLSKQKAERQKGYEGEYSIGCGDFKIANIQPFLLKFQRCSQAVCKQCFQFYNCIPLRELIYFFRKQVTYSKEGKKN